MTRIPTDYSADTRRTERPSPPQRPRLELERYEAFRSLLGLEDVAVDQERFLRWLAQQDETTCRCFRELVEQATQRTSPGAKRPPIIVYRVQYEDGGGWSDVEHEVRRFVREHAGEGARALRETFALAASEDVTAEVLSFARGAKEPS